MKNFTRGVYLKKEIKSILYINNIQTNVIAKYDNSSCRIAQRDVYVQYYLVPLQEVLKYLACQYIRLF